MSAVPRTSPQGGARAPAPAPGSDGQGEPGRCGCRRPVLYVEDSPLNVEVMQCVFSYLPSYRLVVAGDGASAMRRAEVEPPALLLLDLGLPDLDGVELLSRLRGLPALASTPAIAVTGHAPPDLLAAGDFVDVWIKPLRVARVLQGVERWAAAQPAQVSAAA